MASLRTWLNWYKQINIVPLIKQIQSQWSTMLLNLFQNPTHCNKKEYVMDKSLLLVNQLSKPNKLTIYKTIRSVIGNNHHNRTISLLPHAQFYIHDLMSQPPPKQKIPKIVCNKNQAHKAIKRCPICLTESDNDFILNEIKRR